MHAARLTSPRLQRVLKVLRRGRTSSRELMLEASVVAPGTCVAELRARGAEIDCTCRSVDGRKLWFYTMKKEPRDA